ncbi:ZrgA family zinc uptake protein [Lacimicrobium alkaliphilum]|uniref:DUF2796 domain-containing protein n=1 Tax=Lacimicrobium alkaliphilum TaxID=1526571 RepID=A0A0U3B4K6_9ALTE|nr:DUF2796 domain-containing protein [Lacimicrobium alkaliphilum]ALT00001.1 hypothetical protein AT746_18170 [Lacimicrobium alkaliphilum]
MFRIALSLLTLLLCSTAPQAQHKAHTHGEGTLSLAQDNSDWYLELALPAMDLLGFEHAPQNTAQKQKINELADRLGDSDNLIRFSPDCRLTEKVLELPDQHRSDHHHHSDISVQYRFSCPGDVSNARLTIFTWATSLHLLHTQWLTQKSTASARLTPEQPQIEF